MRVPPCLRLIPIVLPPSRREADTNGLAGCRLPASQSFIKGFDLYAYPAGTSFCSCASSRATLHVGSLFPWNRQPSNAPPFLLSPTGRTTRRGPLLQNTLGDTPRPRRTGTPARKAKGRLPEAWAKRCLYGAVGTSAPFPSPEAGEGVPVLHPAYLNSALGKCRVLCPFLGKPHSRTRAPRPLCFNGAAAVLEFQKGAAP